MASKCVGSAAVTAGRASEARAAGKSSANTTKPEDGGNTGGDGSFGGDDNIVVAIQMQWLLTWFETRSVSQ